MQRRVGHRPGRREQRERQVTGAPGVPGGAELAGERVRVHRPQGRAVDGLLARVKSVLRRTTGATASTGPRVRMGRRVLDLEKRVLIDPASGEEETLAASELDLLKVFAENPNRPLNRDWLLEVTAHREMEAFDRAIDLRITRLRRKIEVDPSHPDAIRTVRGVGYMFVPPKD